LLFVNFTNNICDNHNQYKRRFSRFVQEIKVKSNEFFKNCFRFYIGTIVVIIYV
jgi:hypothetical protein